MAVQALASQDICQLPQVWDPPLSSGAPRSCQPLLRAPPPQRPGLPYSHSPGWALPFQGQVMFLRHIQDSA